MNNQINAQGILTFKALTLSKGVFNQIAKVNHNPNGKLIGYVLDEYQMATFIGEEDGKLYRTRQDFMTDTWIAQGKTKDAYRDFTKLLDDEKSKLLQIFIK
jgi:hypothetical protein